MGRGLVIDKHPQRQQIIEALTAGIDSYGKLSQRFGIDKAVLHRYKHKKLLPYVERKERDTNLRTAEYLYDTIGGMMSKLHKMLDACDKYLADPDSGTEYYLGPRSDELKIVYYAGDGGGSWRNRKTAQLQTLLDIVSKGLDIKVSHVSYTHADPRKLILATADSINKQLDLLARLQGQIQSVQVTINNPVVLQLQQIVAEVTADYPEVRQRIAERIRSAATDSPST